jgi:hypothetical protein
MQRNQNIDLHKGRGLEGTGKKDIYSLLPPTEMIGKDTSDDRSYRGSNLSMLRQGTIGPRRKNPKKPPRSSGVEISPITPAPMLFVNIIINETA